MRLLSHGKTWQRKTLANWNLEEVGKQLQMKQPENIGETKKISEASDTSHFYGSSITISNGQLIAPVGQTASH
jgi:hypothetical protein